MSLYGIPLKSHWTKSAGKLYIKFFFVDTLSQPGHGHATPTTHLFLLSSFSNPVAVRCSFILQKNCPLHNKWRVIFHNVKRSSLFPQSPHWHTRGNSHRPRRHTAVAQAASGANHVVAEVHQMPQVVFMRIIIDSRRCRPLAAFRV
jgi:hypothetical protein